MAKKKAKGSQGGGTVTEQIQRLKERIGAKGVKQAAEIIETYEADVIRYAFKTMPKPVGVTGLGARIEAILASVPASEREDMRASLLKAKKKSAGK